MLSVLWGPHASGPAAKEVCDGGEVNDSEYVKN